MRQYIATVTDEDVAVILSVQAKNPNEVRTLVRDFYQKNWNAHLDVKNIKVKIIRNSRKPVQFIGTIYRKEE